jgi:hypothetical protein
MIIICRIRRAGIATSRFGSRRSILRIGRIGISKDNNAGKKGLGNDGEDGV